MNQYKYILEPYNGKKTRFTCPNCQGKHEFTRYLDIENQTYVAEDVGICNNKNKCNYHQTPKQHFNESKHFTNKTLKPNSPIKLKEKNQEISYINRSKVNEFKANHANNDFINYYSAIFNEEEVDNWISNYKLGTFINSGKYKYLNNSIIFWQIDLNDNIRTGKIISYNSKNGKRDKYQHWIHSIQRNESYNLCQVPFGLHLIKDRPNSNIAIVESEKTACIMSTLMPSFVWIAVGGCQNLTYKMLKEISNRVITLFPDAGKYDLWKSKILSLPKSNLYTISDLLHKKTSSDEKQQDFDIADYSLKAYLTNK